MTGRLLRMGLALAISASLLTAPGFAAAQSQPPPPQNQDQKQNKVGQAPGQPDNTSRPWRRAWSQPSLPPELPPAASSAETDAARNLKVDIRPRFFEATQPLPGHHRSLSPDQD